MEELRKFPEYFRNAHGKIDTFRKHYFEEITPYHRFSDAQHIWIDRIPENPDTAVSYGIAVCVEATLVQDPVIDHNRGWYIQNTIPIIPPLYGEKYTVEIFDSERKKVPSSHESGPVFYYESGYLVFEKDPTTYFKPPFSVKCYGYSGRTLADLVGMPQLYPLGAVVFEKNEGYELQVAFVDVSDQVAFVDIYGVDDEGYLVKLMENVKV